MKARRMVGNMEYTLLAVPLELTVARASAYQDEEVRPALVMNLHFSILMPRLMRPALVGLVRIGDDSGLARATENGR
jgi:hypothetical protein